MSGNFERNKISTYESLPLGATIATPFDLETYTKFNPPGQGRWMLLDGRDLNRATVDYDFSRSFPAGVSTSTSRTLNANPNTNTIVADGTNFLAPGTAGTSALQASADASSWSTSATWGASTDPTCIIVAGTRYIMSGTAGDLSAPYVSNTGQTAANQVAKSNWTATTSGATSALVKALAYSPSLGKTVLCPSGAGTTFYYLADGATAWTNNAASTSANKGAVVWTGRYFLSFTLSSNLIQRNPTGSGVWVDSYLPFSRVLGSFVTAASDGAGTVVAFSNSSPVNLGFGSTGTVIVSKDDGDSWRIVSLPQEFSTLTNACQISYANGKFIISNTVTLNFVFSVDGLNWQVEPLGVRGIAPTNAAVVAYKSGVYAGLITGSTSAFSSTEDTSKFRLPGVFAASIGSMAFTQQYIKVTL